MFAEIKKRKPESILDVGCGEGFTLLRLKREHIGDRLEGIEYLEEAIELGKKLDPTMVIKKVIFINFLIKIIPLILFYAQKYWNIWSDLMMQ